MDDSDGSISQKRLVHGARLRALPLNVDCPARCAFCYERRVPAVLPHVRTEHIPRYDDARFDAFRQMVARARDWEAETGRAPVFGILPTFERTPQGIAHFPVCDVFSSGLSHDQIEELVRMREGDVCMLYAVGLNLDLDFIAYLTRRYPETFRLHLSIVTFDPDLRRQLMNPDIDVDVLRRACTLTRDATFFLMLLTADQLAADVEEVLAATSADNGGLFVHKLYYDRCSPRRVVELAREAALQREVAVRRIASLPRAGRRIMCSLGADIQAYTRRFEIYTMLSRCTEEADEVIFCSPGTYAVIDGYYRSSGNLVRAMGSAFGGNLDFVQGCTARDVVAQLEELVTAGHRLRRVVVPDAMFWLDGAYDLNGERAESIAAAFPDLSLEVVAVPPEVVCSVVDLDDCLVYFNDFHRPVAAPMAE